MSDILFKKNQKYDYISSDNYLNYVIIIYLFKNGPSVIEDIFKYLNNEIFKGKIKFGKLKEFLILNFSTSDDKFYLDSYKSNLAIKENCFLDYLNYNYYSGLNNDISSDFSNDDYEHSFDDFFKKYLNSMLANKVKTKEEILYIYFDISYNFDYYRNSLCQSILNIKPTYYNLDISKFVIDKEILQILTFININNINDLINKPINLLIVLFSINFDYYLKSMKALSSDYIERQKELAKIVYSLSDDLKIDILNNRIVSNKKTLQELGKEYNLTRERIRQIESKYLKLLSSISKENSEVLNLTFFMIQGSKHYITFEKIREKVNDQKTSNALLALYKVYNNNLIFEDKFHIIYDKNYVDFQGIKDSILKKYELVISREKYDALGSLEKGIVDESYHFVKSENFYLKNGCNINELYGIIIRNNFPKGYKIGSTEDLNKLLLIANQKFGINLQSRSERALCGLIDHNKNLILIDRGTYQHIDNIPKLTDFLYAKIINYIYSEQIAIYYSSIYLKFKEELNESGINNIYMLKGLLDLKLPSDLHHSKDYISIGRDKHSAYEAVVVSMMSFDGVFSLDDLKQKFPGVGEYVFNSIISYEKDIIQISKKEFIYENKIGITAQTINELKNYIDSLFAEFNVRTLSSRKIYARLKMFNNELFCKININSGHYELFSILKYLYKDLYYFDRPLVSLDMISKGSTYEILKNHFQDSQEFDYGEIKKYIYDLNLCSLNSYLNFMDDMSDDFVQYNIDSMKSKNIFEKSVDKDFTKKVDNVLELFFDRSDKINTENFNGYRLLPVIKNYDWNKYLLVGIIKTFLNNKYIVENTGNMYNKTDYIIMRSMYEQ